MKSIFIYASACERRELDATRIKQYFIKNGYKIVWRPKDADIIIIITCDLLDKIRDFNLEKIREFEKYNAELIVGGCLPDISKDKLNEIFNGKTISTKDLNEKPEKMDQLFPENKIPFKEVGDENFLFPPLYDEGKPSCIFQKVIRNIDSLKSIFLNIEDFTFKSSDQTNVHWWHPIKRPLYHVRTSYGCPSNCSYCAIKKAIGPFHSKPLEQCIQEFKNGLDHDFKLIFINADDIGGYGIDIGSSLPELLDIFTSFPGDYKLAVRSLNPPWIVKYIDELEEILKRNKIINMEIPIQSGSKRILKLMNRYSNIEKMKDTFIRLRQSSKSLKVNTHYIAGFPTETKNDFKQTLAFIDETKFNAGTIFPFSLKTGTKAEEIEPKVPRSNVFKWFDDAKKILKQSGYKTLYRPEPDFFIFYQSNP